MTRSMLGWLVYLLLLSPVAAQAQAPVKNPTAVEFTSPDHALLTLYEIDIVRNDGSVAQTLILPKDQAAAQPNGDWRLTINVQPIAFGAYTVVVRAVAGLVKSDNSLPSESWVRAPGPPSKPLVK